MRKNTTLNQRHFSFMEKFLIKWETRALGLNIDRIIAIIPCVVYADKIHIDDLLSRANEALSEYLKPNLYTLPRIMDRITLRVLEYSQDEKLYLQDRVKIFDILLQDVQLYSIVIDIYSAPEFSHLLKIFETRLQEKYDEQYNLNAAGKRILRFQEKYST
ncbi:hypothetical protein [Helicobacter himalayensis]|uniref:hypothetical protein n=1 Tax=Helicobacter himalayensis TaxID=1591088 RepID=UPI000835C53A|nr:hypothetical protein [Helicobacter himalayensis]